MNHTADSHATETRRPQEFMLLGLVALTAIIANLPGDLLAPLGVKPAYLLALLGFIVVLALFLYLRFFFFLLYVLLAVGANVPAQWAEALGISQLPLIITLGAMVGLSLLNYAVKLLPSGVETAPAMQKQQSSAATKALLAAIERGNAQQVKQILSMGLDPNVANAAGLTLLMLAAQSGHDEIVAALLAAGADPSLTNAGGQTARDLAFRKGHVAIVKRLTPATD